MEKAREFQKNIYFYFIDYIKTFDCVDHNKLENSSRDANTRLPYLPPENADQEATVRIGHETTNWFQIGKGIHQAVYCHPAYLTYMQSTSCEMLGCMKQKLESRLPGEIAITSDMQKIPTSSQRVKRN